MDAFLKKRKGASYNNRVCQKDTGVKKPNESVIEG